MASVNNNWVGYLDRSYQQIKTSVLARVTISNPEMTDHSPSNIFVVLVDIFAAIGEMIGYYIDNISREAFMLVATQRKSILNHALTMDYRVRARAPETVDVTLIWTDDAGTPTVTSGAFTLSAGSYVENSTGVRFITLQDEAIGSGVAQSVIGFSQVTKFLNQVLGTTDGTKNQEISLGTNYAQGTATVTINGQAYTEVVTFANSIPTDYHFQIDIKSDGNAYITFGNNINGVTPPTGNGIQVTYQTTLGPTGVAGAGTLTSNLELLGTLPADTSADPSNALNSSGGSNYEDTEDIRNNAVRSVKINDRMVTWEDYEDHILTVQGVGKSKVNFCCGKTLAIYISPTAGGIASSVLLSTAQAEADLKKTITTFPTLLAAGEAKIVIGMNVTAKIREDVAITKTDVEAALVNYGSISEQSINNSIRLSDIQALVDNLDKVDFLNLTSLYIMPYARPVNHVNTLDWVNQTLAASAGTTSWRLTYTVATTSVSLFREGLFEATIMVGVEYISADGALKFTVNAGAYADGNSWTFNSYVFLQDITINDFSLPVVQLTDLDIIVESQSPTARNAQC